MVWVGGGSSASCKKKKLWWLGIPTKYEGGHNHGADPNRCEEPLDGSASLCGLPYSHRGVGGGWQLCFL